jgi:hypothetical protein
MCARVGRIFRLTTIFCAFLGTASAQQAPRATGKTPASVAGSEHRSSKPQFYSITPGSVFYRLQWRPPGFKGLSFPGAIPSPPTPPLSPRGAQVPQDTKKIAPQARPAPSAASPPGKETQKKSAVWGMSRRVLFFLFQLALLGGTTILLVLEIRRHLRNRAAARDELVEPIAPESARSEGRGAAPVQERSLLEQEIAGSDAGIGQQAERALPDAEAVKPPKADAEIVVAGADVDIAKQIDPSTPIDDVCQSSADDHPPIIPRADVADALPEPVSELAASLRQHELRPSLVVDELPVATTVDEIRIIDRRESVSASRENEQASLATLVERSDGAGPSAAMPRERKPDSSTPGPEVGVEDRAEITAPRLGLSDNFPDEVEHRAFPVPPSKAAFANVATDGPVIPVEAAPERHAHHDEPADREVVRLAIVQTHEAWASGSTAPAMDAADRRQPVETDDMPEISLEQIASTPNAEIGPLPIDDAPEAPENFQTQIPAGRSYEEEPPDVADEAELIRDVVAPEFAACLFVEERLTTADEAEGASALAETIVEPISVEHPAPPIERFPEGCDADRRVAFAGAERDDRSDPLRQPALPDPGDGRPAPREAPETVPAPSPAASGSVKVIQPSPAPASKPERVATLDGRPREEWKDKYFGPILSRAGIEAPDGRPLCTYSFSPEDYARVEAFLKLRLRKDANALPSTSAAFVFWASEYIRANFPPGVQSHLSWAFLFDAFELPENQPLAKRMVENGLGWWNRDVREARNGNRLYLYSLLVEGGLPEALLTQEGLYRRVILGLVKDIEAEGGGRAGALVAEEIAARRLQDLPQTFRSDEFARLLGELGLALAKLRAAPPADLSPEEIAPWLTQHRPSWAEELPLRASAETIDKLITPALRLERPERAPSMPLLTRELRRDLDGCWRSFIRVAEKGWLPGAALPGAEDLRLRLVPDGALARSGDAPSLVATPERGGWQLRVFGKNRRGVAQIDLSTPIVFTAFADARPKGDVELDPGLPEPVEAVSLWRSAESDDQMSDDLLTPSPGGRTRASWLFALTSADTRPVASGGLCVEGPQSAHGGSLWRASGKGELRLGAERIEIETGAAAEAPEAKIVPLGPTLSGWKTAGGAGLVYLGRPSFWGQKGPDDLSKLGGRSLTVKTAAGRMLGRETAEWIENGVRLARLRYLTLPRELRISVREKGPVRARLTLDGLNIPGMRVAVRAGEATEHSELQSGACDIEIISDGPAPSEISLRLTAPATGDALELVAPWPSLHGMLLGPDGRRLERNLAVAAEALGDWRAVAPPDVLGHLHIRLWDREIVLSVAGETPLGAHLPLVRSLLAQGGPDAQVDIWLVVGGSESRRLEVRRYADNAIIRNGVLHVGLNRGAPPLVETVFTDVFGARRAATLHAVDLRSGEGKLIDTSCPCDLEATLGAGGPWLIQPRLDGRPQRAVFFDTRSIASTSRDERIDSLTSKWRALIEKPLSAEWSRVWRMIESLSEGGDAGVADEVQALAHVPAAAVLLVLRAPRKSLVDALALDLAAPIFWPATLVEAFIAAVGREHMRRRNLYQEMHEAAEAVEKAGSTLLSRIDDILALRPDLAAHFGRALIEVGLIGRVLAPEAPSGLREKVIVAKPAEKLFDCAQVAARRFDRLPYGVRGLTPLRRPFHSSFDKDTQAVVDAPIVAAEIAAGRRAAANPAEILSLIGLRLVDPAYFDEALPLALALSLES